MVDSNNAIQPIQDPYKPHKVKIKGKIYLTKLDKQTKKHLYKRKVSISLPGVKSSPRLYTREWRTSITKVNQDVEKSRTEVRSGKHESKKIADLIDKDKKATEQVKHLYKDIVEEIYKKEVENCIKLKKSFETIEKFNSNNRKYVLNVQMEYPNLLDRYVEDLTIEDIKQLKKDILGYAIENGLSQLTIGHVFTNIDRTLKYCAESMYIEDKIPNSVYISTKGAKPRRRLTIKNYLLKEEFDYMIKVFDTHFTFLLRDESPEQTEYRKRLYYTYFNCAFYMGFRKAEGFGMMWGDYQGEKTYIRSTLNTKAVKKHLKTVGQRLIDPKTDASIREMHTPKTVRKCLDEWKEHCKSLGMNVSDTQYIFRELGDEPFNPTTFDRRFYRVLEVSKVQVTFDKDITPHGFRHSCCSFLIQKLREADPEISLREIEIAVGSYLGHSSGKMVHEVYGHLYPEKEKSLMNQVLDEI
ncbi:MAG: tyrosine-type recombinase/integrase [Coprobacillaceae bacterium]